MVRQHLLPSALRIVTEQMAGARSASLGVFVGVGFARREPRTHGASTSWSTCSSRAPRALGLDISIALDAVGGEFNAFTAKEYTCYHARVLADDLPVAVDVLGT